MTQSIQSNPSIHRLHPGIDQGSRTCRPSLVSLVLCNRQPRQQRLANSLYGVRRSSAIGRGEDGVGLWCAAPKLESGKLKSCNMRFVRASVRAGPAEKLAEFQASGCRNHGGYSEQLTRAPRFNEPRFRISSMAFSSRRCARPLETELDLAEPVHFP